MPILRGGAIGDIGSHPRRVAQARGLESAESPATLHIYAVATTVGAAAVAADLESRRFHRPRVCTAGDPESEGSPEMLQNVGRLHDIAGILIRHGFGDMVRRIGMAGALERTGRVLHWQAPQELARLEPPARVRRALEQLGPTFVKLGQILATRVDLFEPAWVDEFSKLQDASPTLPFESLRAQLVEDLGDEPENVFDELVATPLASGSLAQVYTASLKDGTPVILKVRRPGIRPVIDADLRLLARLADLVDTRLPELRRYRLRDVVRQFRRSLHRELDFAAECRNAERVAENFRDHPEILVPRVHWHWTGERLNVQDRVVGVPGRHLAAIEAACLDRKLLARRGADTVLKMMLEDGFFHADPHPGNVFYLPGNRISLIDFGMVGRLSEQRRLQVALLMKGLAGHDPGSVVDVLMQWAGDDAEIDVDELRSRIDDYIDDFHGIPLGELHFGALLVGALAILREQQLPLPPDLALLIKAFITLEGLGRSLDPDFDMAGAATPFLTRVVAKHYAPAAIVRRGRSSAMRMIGLLGDLPRDLEHLLRAARRGKLKVDVNVEPLERFGERIDRAASRLTVGIVVAALIVGSSIVVTREGGFLPGWPPLSLIAFVAAGVGGLWLLGSIWRSGHRRVVRRRDRKDSSG
jgi:ubiquinone biosynthesis protein